MNELNGIKEEFFVLEYADTPGCYDIDDQIMITDNIKAATHYPEDLAKTIAKKSKGKYIVKKVTVLYVIDNL